jgi:apolipoprotein N-acyltransferase
MPRQYVKPLSLRPLTVAFLRIAASALSGLLLYSAFEPMANAETAWVGLVPLMAMTAYATPGRAFGAGWIGGMFFWLPSVSWLLNLRTTGGVPWFMIGAGWFGLSAYCSLYAGAFAALASRLFSWAGYGRPEGGGSFARNGAVMLLLPTVWVGLEYVRSTLFTGFAWNQLGVSQYRVLPVIQVAEIGGAYAVSWVLVLVNSAILFTGMRFLSRRRSGRLLRFHPELAFGLLVLMVCIGWGQFRWTSTVAGSSDIEAIRVGVVQPAIAQNDKWSDDKERFIYTRLSELTELSGLLKPDLIVWPETALPAALNTDTNAYAFVSGLARSCRAPLLAGALEYKATFSKDFFYNSSFLFDCAGAEAGVYRKQHLVILGEYLPFEDRWPWMGVLSPLGYSCSAGTESTVFRLGGVSGRRPLPPFSVLICFEDTVGKLARMARIAGAAFLVVQTNDAWFDGTPAPVQHLAHSVMRAVENRVPIVRCANSGVSCYIGPDGSMDVLSAGTILHGFAGFQPFEFRPARVGKRTVYGRFGDIVLAIPSAGITALVFLLVLRDSRLENRRRGSSADLTTHQPGAKGGMSNV